MSTKKTSLPVHADGDTLVIGRGTDAIKVKAKGGNLILEDGTPRVAGHYPDMYPWATPHMHPEEDVYRNFACDLSFPPDNIPVAAIPRAIRELKRLAIGGWVVNAPVSEDIAEGAIVRWDDAQQMWVPALVSDITAPVEPSTPGEGEGTCLVQSLPDTDLPSDVETVPPAQVEMPCTDFDEKLEQSPTQAFAPVFMGVALSANSVQAHGVVRHSSFSYPARTPLYLSATNPGRVTDKNTGVFVGTVLVPGVLLLNVYGQIFERYIEVVKEELVDKISCTMERLVEMGKVIGKAIEAGDSANAEALKTLEEFIKTRLQTLQSFLDTVNRQYEELQVDIDALAKDVADLKDAVDANEADGGRGFVVNTIAGREELKDEPEGTIVYVRDASSDPAVKSGPATYILVGQGADAFWSNITASIKIDGGDVLEGIDVTQLQNAIAKAHGHDNKALLDSITSFGEKGVKIGDVTIINSDGTLPGGSGSGDTPPSSDGITVDTPITIPGTDPTETTDLSEIAGDVAELKDTKWVKALDAMPTAANFAEVLADVPEGGLFSVPSTAGEEEEDTTATDIAALKERCSTLEATDTAITQTVTVTTPGEGEDAEPVVTQEKRLAAHQDEQGIYGVATASKYGHVRLLSDPSSASVSTGDTFSASAIKELMSGRGSLQWPNGQVPSIGTMLDSSSFLITSSGTFTLPAGKYSVEVVGGGGAGGVGSTNSSGKYYIGIGGTGGGSSTPTIGAIALNAAASCTVSIGAGGGNTTLTLPDIQRTITSSAGTAGYGGGVGSEGSYGASGPSYSHAGGSGGAGERHSGSYQGDPYVDGAGGGGGGAGSRFSRQITSIAAQSGGSATKYSYTGGGGGGGIGYGAGGGGAGQACKNASGCASGTPGAGAQGCILIVALL